jgi:hypothetical protein
MQSNCKGPFGNPPLQTFHALRSAPTESCSPDRDEGASGVRPAPLCEIIGSRPNFRQMETMGKTETSQRSDRVAKRRLPTSTWMQERDGGHFVAATSFWRWFELLAVASIDTICPSRELGRVQFVRPNLRFNRQRFHLGSAGYESGVGAGRIGEELLGFHHCSFCLREMGENREERPIPIRSCSHFSVAFEVNISRSAIFSFVDPRNSSSAYLL